MFHKSKQQGAREGQQIATPDHILFKKKSKACCFGIKDWASATWTEKKTCIYHGTTFHEALV